MGVRSSWTLFKRMLWSRIAPAAENGLDFQAICKMARGIATSHAREIGCKACFGELDRFAEATLAGRNVAGAMPLVQDHLNRCRDCRQEFDALLVALSPGA